MVGGVLMMAVAWVADVNGSAGGASALFSLTWEQLYRLAILMAAIGGALTILRHDWILHEAETLYGNEHAQQLWKDGIPATLDTYLRYVGSGDFQTVTRFWRAGFLGGKDFQGRSDLHLACLMGHPAIVQELLKRGVDPAAATPDGHTPLLLAAVNGNARIIELLSDHKCNPDACASINGCSAIFAAAAKGHVSAVEKLIALGAKVDRSDTANMTPLMAAISQQKFETARLLIKAGANLNRKDETGATLMDYAETFSSSVDIIEKLRNHGVQRTPDIRHSGGGSSWDGHVSVRWETERQREEIE